MQDSELTLGRWLWHRSKRALVWRVGVPTVCMLGFLLEKAPNPTVQGWAVFIGIVGFFWAMLGYPAYGYRLVDLLAGTSRRKTVALSTVFLAACGLFYLSVGHPRAPENLPAFIIPFSLLGLLGLAGLIRGIFAPDRVGDGVKAFQEGKPQVALEQWEGAAFVDEKRPLLRGILARLAQADPAVALALATHLTRVAPGEADGWRARSFVVGQVKDVKESLPFLDRAMKLDPRNAEDHYNRGVRLSLDPATCEAAVKEYTTAIGLDSQQARYWANRAALYNRLGRHDLALVDARKAAALDPSDQVARVQAQIAQQGKGWSGGTADAGGASLGLMRVTSSGAQELRVSGDARPLFELSHGGDTDQYLEFCPRGRYLASWIPERLEVFDLDSQVSLGRLDGEGRGLIGFGPDGDALLTVYGGVVERHALPSLEPLLEDGFTEEGPGWRLKDGTACSTLTGFALSATHPESSIAFPYHYRICPATDATAQPGAHCALLLTGDRTWSSPDVRRDVTSVAFSSDGARLAFGTMGGSVFIVDTSGPDVTHQCLADGEIRCLAVSSTGLVAAGCADLSTKTWIFDLETGQPAHLVDCSSDTWAVAFSPDGRLLATGHENGKVRLWKVDDLPRPHWS